MMRLTRTAVPLLFLFFVSQPLFGYGVLSHEQLIDICWDSDIRPALLKRFPAATDDELKQAHAYAYGGSVIQDLGYYPFGNHEFTNLLHYVRTGDFVAWMLRDSRNVNEFAFALGALSHYAADVWGHPGVNAGVAIEYPNLQARFGKIVTYEDNPEAHLKTEFSFDVLQVAKRRYISKQYHDFIGFEASEDLLERAFRDNYGISLDDMLHFDDLTIETFRFSVSRVIPEMTQVALATRKPDVGHEKHDRARAEFLYHISRADYERDFGSEYRKPGIFARILALFLRLIPKFGPFKALTYRDPTPQTEDLYFKSMDNVVDQYHRLVGEVNAQRFTFADRNLDIGEVTRAGQYRLADETYADLVRRLDRGHFRYLTPALKARVLEYFASGPVQQSVKGSKWHGTARALAALRTAPTTQAGPTQTKTSPHSSNH
jgi:zinc dependent phospholipase C